MSDLLQQVHPYIDKISPYLFLLFPMLFISIGVYKLLKEIYTPLYKVVVGRITDFKPKVDKKRSVILYYKPIVSYKGENGQRFSTVLKGSVSDFYVFQLNNLILVKYPIGEIRKIKEVDVVLPVVFIVFGFIFMTVSYSLFFL